MSTWAIIVAGFCVHAVVFISIFDIYFTLPLIGGLPGHSSPRPAPAKRLIFIVADGLRADKTFTLLPDGSTPAPYLRNIAEEQGVWGVSVASVPTATRPGHVAMTSGFFEDPTSVGKDIGGGAINFDNIFQETAYTWTWDTPKFLEKVAESHKDRIVSEQFPGERKYLSGINPKDMDSWVFQEVTSFIDKAKTDEGLKERMNKDKVLFFLHLGGIDHAGYIVRPNSKEYIKHVSFLDTGVKDIVQKFEDFFGHDGKTAFVFTSDHGMTNWGAHGEGMPDEINCPLLVWGSGIRKAIIEDNSNKFKDTLSTDWSLTKWKRTDIDQASLAPLMSAIIGTTYPRNAVYPLPEGFFDIPEQDLFEIMFANLNQLRENFHAIEKYIHRGPFAFTYRAFKPFSRTLIKSSQTDILAQKDIGNYKSAIALTQQKIELTLQGIRHYLQYSKYPLWIATFASLTGWLCFCALVLIQQHQNWEDIKVTTPLMANTKHIIIQCAAAITAFDLLFLYAQSTPVTQCLHFLLPIPVWTAAVIKWYEIGNIFPIIKRQKGLLLMTGLCVFALLLIALAMYQRVVLAFVIAGFAFITVYGNKTELDGNLKKQWLISSLGLALMAGLPIGDRDLHYNLVLFSGVIGTIASIVFHFELGSNVVKGKLCRPFGQRFAIFQILKIGLATGVLWYSSYLIENNIRTPLFVQIPSWVIFFVSLLEPVCVNTDIQSRLVTISFGFLAPFILLSIGQETLCFIILVWNLYVYVEVERNLTKSQPIFLPRTSGESINPNKAAANGSNLTNGHPTVKHHKHTKSNDYLLFQPTVAEWQNLDFSKAAEEEKQCKRVLTSGDLRRSLYCILVAYGSLGGTGNIYSINSFDVQDVMCFITISNPPRMGPLMIFKWLGAAAVSVWFGICLHILLMPAIVIACFIRAINMITFTSQRNFSMILALLSTFLTMVTFVLVTDNGTWTDIGETISHFLITVCITMFTYLQVGIVYLLTTISIR